MLWHAVFTQPRMELWVRSNLWERGYEVYLPRYLRRRRHARKTELVPYALFPRYMFVRADLEQGGQRAIASAPGVIDLVRMGRHPSSVRDTVIDEIRSREDDEGYIHLGREIPFKAGDKVRVMAGSLCDQVGLFETRTDQERVIILLSLLGRQVRVKLHGDDVHREL